jgi:hypothetical protein
MRIFKNRSPSEGMFSTGIIEYGVFLQNMHGMYYFLQDGSMYGYLYNYVDTYNSPRAIEEIKRK